MTGRHALLKTYTEIGAFSATTYPATPLPLRPAADTGWTPSQPSRRTPRTKPAPRVAACSKSTTGPPPSAQWRWARTPRKLQSAQGSKEVSYRLLTRGEPAGRPAEQPSPPHARFTLQSKISLPPAQLAGPDPHLTAAVMSPRVSARAPRPPRQRPPDYPHAKYCPVLSCVATPHRMGDSGPAGGCLPELRTPPDPTQGPHRRGARPAPYPPVGAHSDTA